MKICHKIYVIILFLSSVKSIYKLNINQNFCVRVCCPPARARAWTYTRDTATLFHYRI